MAATKEVLSGKAGIASDAPQSGLQATKLWHQLAPSHLASHYLPGLPNLPSIHPSCPRPQILDEAFAAHCNPEAVAAVAWLTDGQVKPSAQD